MTVNDVSPPTVSVIIANHNGGRFIQDALASCLRQTLKTIEIIVIDDASTDDSVGRVGACALLDDRIRLIQLNGQHGPGGARNHGLATARGIWLAVLDSDDIMHPQRLSQLVEAAERRGAEIVADNQLLFDDARVQPSRILIDVSDLPEDGLISTVDYINSNRLFTRSMPLGYLKPLMLRSFLASNGIEYDPSLPIAEDYDLVLRLLLAGARFHVQPQVTYFYRRHSHSISHRLSKSTLLPMIRADDDLRTTRAAILDPSIRQALDRRLATIGRAIDFDTLVQELKARRWGRALRLCVRRPGVAALLVNPLRDRLTAAVRPGKRRPRPSGGDRRISLISRQRIIGTTNGSSAYLLSLCRTLVGAGYELELISPSPAMFGRWPFLRLDRSMDIFMSIHIRGAFRVGRFVFAKDVRIAGRAARGIAQRLLVRFHVGLGGVERKAPHAIAVPLTDADRLFISDRIGRSAFILADYVFLNEAVPFALQPRAANAVVMHDLFSRQDASGTVVLLDHAMEMSLLDLADTVIAIQAEEEEVVRRHLPAKHTILAPMAVSPVTEAEPGDDGRILFVGSNTVPNLDGIRWFLAHVWDGVLKLCPQAVLEIAGTCCGSLADLPANVTLLGRVDDLDDAYRRAGIVISPLRLGSGLKIKLIEAIGHGKAVVATTTTLQGVHDAVSPAVMHADSVADFTDALVGSLYDRAKRLRLGRQALAVAAARFSATACYRDLLDVVGTRILQTVDEP